MSKRQKGLKREYKYVSYCGKYYCAFCDYYKGTIVKATKKLLAFAERYGSLKLIANANNTWNFDEFMKGLKWLASAGNAMQRLSFRRRMVLVGRLSSS